MATELTTAETAALIASQLRGHVCAIADEYRIRLEQWGPEPDGEGKYKPIDAKEYQARQTALKIAATNIDLLLKVARNLESAEGRRPEAENEAAWEAEADANLALPEP